jgi:hypothetical protein
MYRTVIFPVVLCGCQTWPLTLREGNRIRVFVNRVLTTIRGSESDEVTGEWRRLHSEELNGLYSSPNVIRAIKSRRMRWAGHVARIGRRELHIGIWRGNVMERDHLKDPGIDGG